MARELGKAAAQMMADRGDPRGKILLGMFAQADAGRCPGCKAQVNVKDFKDQRSLTEFRISGFCQKCQDSTFVED